MKTNILWVMFLFAAGFSFAQKKNVTDAAMLMKKYNPMAGAEKAKETATKAKGFIDLAAVNPDTKEDMKMHLYRGMIYFALLEVAQMDAMAGKAPNDTLLDGHKDISMESFTKVLNDPKGKYAQDAERFIGSRVEQYFSKGLGMYQNKNYEMAFMSFAGAYKINLFLGQEYEDAKVNAMITFSYVADSLIRAEELVKAEELTNVANDLFPNTLEILYKFINIYLKNEDNVMLEKYTEQALDIDNSNKQLYFILGVNYQQAGNFEKSEENYLKILVIDSVDEQANSNLATLYLDKARENYKSGNLDKSQEYYNKSIPPLRFLNKIDPNNYVYVQILLDALYMSNNSKDGDEFLSRIENGYNTRIEEIDKLISQDKNESNITQVVDLYSNLSELYSVSLTGSNEKKEIMIENKKKSIMTKAIPYMIELHNLNPDDTSLMIEIAKAYSSIKDFEKRNFWLKKSKE